jgi:hypothetical protein
MVLWPGRNWNVKGTHTGKLLQPSLLITHSKIPPNLLFSIHLYSQSACPIKATLLQLNIYGGKCCNCLHQKENGTYFIFKFIFAQVCVMFAQHNWINQSIYLKIGLPCTGPNTLACITSDENAVRISNRIVTMFAGTPRFAHAQRPHSMLLSSHNSIFRSRLWSRPLNTWWVIRKVGEDITVVLCVRICQQMQYTMMNKTRL